ncbi:hypothetical protein LH935_28020 (plasmid) [Gordonia polyisoprenivorans]|uniref:hypothetical protein n=1 Tax=Gordonia polyisoprenivorans TaxID=84595 RepID=UPI0022342960|nr:hypothetical protein [uncultured Gordonia sp.]UZF59335.1 hypothetical protein LH935_28020 [Gordonia polyisoprenivorans]
MTVCREIIPQVSLRGHVELKPESGLDQHAPITVGPLSGQVIDDLRVGLDHSGERDPYRFLRDRMVPSLCAHRHPRIDTAEQGALACRLPVWLLESFLDLTLVAFDGLQNDKSVGPSRVGIDAAFAVSNFA